ncbi:MAG: hypothetical protein RLZZ182_2508 [Pseudomonadota bacterium]
MADSLLSQTRSHRKVFGAIVLVVLLVHALATRGVMHELALARGDEASSIDRMEATFDTDMQLTEPPVVVAQADAAEPEVTEPTPEPEPEPEAPQAPEPAPSKPDAAASTPEQPASAPDEKASEPERPASQALAAASAPDSALPPSPPASQASVQAGSNVFQWPKATRVSFKLSGYLRGEIHGTAQVEWVRQGSKYQVHVDAILGPSFAPLGSQRWTSEGYITKDGLVPERFESINKLLIKTNPPKVVRFTDATVILPNGDEFEKLPGVQDPASHYIQIAYHMILDNSPLTPGNMVGVPMVWTKKQEMVIYNVAGEEQIKTPLGDINTFKLVPMNVTNVKGGDVLAEVWIAPQLQYLPIRMLLRQGPDTYLQMDMDKPPQQTPADDPPEQQVRTPPAPK